MKKFSIVKEIKFIVTFFALAALSACGSNENQSSVSSVVNNDFEVSNTEANDGFYKYQMLSEMYSNTLIDIYYTSNVNKLDYLYQYSDDELKEIITLSREHIEDNSKFLRGGFKCDDAIANLYVVPNRTYDINDFIQIDHQYLSNGKIRSHIKINKDNSIQNYDFDTIKDFDLNCKNGDCTINDVFDSKGNSTKELFNRFCR